MTVERILKSKGSYAPVVVPDAKISDVIAAIEAEEVGALVVSKDGRSIDGIISERDIVLGLREFGPAILDKKVADLMTSNVVTCQADDPIAGVMAMMDQQRIRHIPIVDEGELAGIVSIRDIIKLRLDEVQRDADAMREYIGR